MQRQIHGMARATLAALAIGTFADSVRAEARTLRFRTFSDAAAIGPPAEAYASKLESLSRSVLGPDEALRLTRIPGIPAIPAAFGGNIVAAVAAGEAGGGFDAAYVGGTDLNAAWGFVYNSGIPFGPSFEEFLGFLYGQAAPDAASGLQLLETLLDRANGRVKVFPIVANGEQLSGYFPLPLSDAADVQGIGLAGLCEQPWTLRYLPPGQDVIEMACDELVAQGRIKEKQLRFITAIPGNGTLIDGLRTGALQGFEFATPLDDVFQLFSGEDNPGTLGARFVHAPGWQQPFLITYLVIGADIWSSLSPAQQALLQVTGREHVLSSYAENMARQGPALTSIMTANDGDADPANDLIASQWPAADQKRLWRATRRMLDERLANPALPAADRQELALILDALRTFVSEQDGYWDIRRVDPRSRFGKW